MRTITIKVRRFLMRKNELIAIVTTGLIATYATYHYESNQFDTSKKEPVKESSKYEQHITPIGDAPDFAAIKQVKLKKQAFFDYLRPGIAIENQRIEKERLRLLAIANDFQSGSVTLEQLEYAKRVGKLYNLALDGEQISQAWLSEMLHRVNVIPQGLVMVQGANESAWGTSRFATQANNYFGQWCYKKGCGLVPLQRSEGSTHEVAKFVSVQQSIHGYFMNVNRNRAYKELREIRFQRAQAGLSLTNTDAAAALTNGLLKYSERGEAYVNDLQSMIRHNKQYWESPITSNN